MPQRSSKVITLLTSPSKPTLWMLMLQHGIQLLDLAKASHQDPLVLWGMLTDHPVQPEQAIQVLGVINEIVGTNYELKNIVLNLGVSDGQRTQEER